jgi:hypothetical protein
MWTVSEAAELTARIALLRMTMLETCIAHLSATYWIDYKMVMDE